MRSTIETFLRRVPIIRGILAVARVPLALALIEAQIDAIERRLHAKADTRWQTLEQRLVTADVQMRAAISAERPLIHADVRAEIRDQIALANDTVTDRFESRLDTALTQMYERLSAQMDISAQRVQGDVAHLQVSLDGIVREVTAISEANKEIIRKVEDVFAAVLQTSHATIEADKEIIRKVEDVFAALLQTSHTTIEANKEIIRKVEDVFAALLQTSHATIEADKEIIRKVEDVFAALLHIASTTTNDLGVIRQQIEETRRSRSVYLGDHRALMITAWGSKMIVPTRDLSLTPYLVTEGSWETPVTKAFFQIVREGNTVVEVGANIGYYTVLGAYRIGPAARYYAFEANPEAFGYLHANVEISGLLERTTLVNTAVYSHTTTLTLHRRSDHLGDSSVVQFGDALPPTPDESFDTLDVEATTLDDYFAGQDVHIDLVKIDAEGSEPHVLRGMRRLLENESQICVIFEYVPRWIAKTIEPRTLLKELAALGFRFWVITAPDGALQSATIPQLLKMERGELVMARQLPPHLRRTRRKVPQTSNLGND